MTTVREVTGAGAGQIHWETLSSFVNKTTVTKDNMSKSEKCIMKILKRHLKNVPNNNPHINKIKNWGEPGDFYSGNFLSTPKTANAPARDQKASWAERGHEVKWKSEQKKQVPVQAGARFHRENLIGTNRNYQTYSPKQQQQQKRESKKQGMWYVSRPATKSNLLSLCKLHGDLASPSGTVSTV